MVSSLKEGPPAAAGSAAASPTEGPSPFRDSPRKRPALAPAQRRLHAVSEEDAGQFPPPLRSVRSDGELGVLVQFPSTEFSAFSNSAFSNFSTRAPAKPLPLLLSSPFAPAIALRAAPPRAQPLLLGAAVTPPLLAPPRPLAAVGGSPAGGAGLAWAWTAASIAAAAATTAAAAVGNGGSGGASSPSAASPSLAPVFGGDDDEAACP
jgi:hypothetical protein